MRLCYEMLISFYIIAVTLSNKRETLKYTVTTYAVGFYRHSPLLSEGNFYYFHFSGISQ